MIKTIIALNGQTVFDLCLQIGYPLELSVKLMQDSGISNINDTNIGGKTITFDTDYITNFGSNSIISTGKFVDLADLPDTGNYILRQDGNILLRQDGNNFLRQ